MTHTTETQSPYLDQKEAAAFLRLSPRTLEGYRVLGRGPAFRKFGKKVLYTVSDLTEWAEKQRRTSTSDQGAA
jgi:Helix-turn-helix domain